MERSSSRKNLRTERIGQSPYSRPDRSKRSNDTLKSFPSIASLVSFVSSPFRRSAILPAHSTDQGSSMAVDNDDRSVSGSEDNWDGELPETIAGHDLFSFAAAQRQTEEEVKEQSQRWQAAGEKVGGRRDAARRGLTTSTSTWQLAPPSAHSPAVRPSPSMPCIPHANIDSTVRTALPPRGAIPSFQTLSKQMPVSPSSMALAAFLEAKHGGPMTAEDLTVLDTLTHSIKAESAGFPASVSTSDVKLGGWSAGTYAASPRPESSFATPNKSASPFNGNGTPGPSFSIGRGDTPLSSRTPLTGQSKSSSPHKVTYLGPGMSPRRLFPKRSSGLRSLLSPQPDVKEDDLKGKKRRVAEDDEEMTVDDEAPAPVSYPSRVAPEVSISSGNRLNGSSLTAPKQPSSLRQSTVAGDDVVAKAKKRAADIMLEVIDAEIGPLEPAAPPAMVINPYEEVPHLRRSPQVASSPSRNTPLKSGLRQSIRSSGTPTRGAAERIERLKTSHRVTTLEKVSDYRPAPLAGPTSPPKHVRIQQPEKDEDESDVDALIEPDRTPPQPLHVPTPSAFAPTPSKSALKVPEPTPFPPFSVPSLSSSSKTSNLPSAPSVLSQSVKPVHKPETSFVFDSIVNASKSTPSTTFAPSKVTISRPAEVEPAPKAAPPPAVSASSSTSFSAMFLSSRDSALQVARAALPFFTFSLPVSSAPKPSAAVRQAVSKNPVTTYTFTQTMSVTTASTSIPSVFLKPQDKPGQWKCGVCDCFTPDAQSKCMVCESERPRTAPASSSVPVMPPPASSAIIPNAFFQPQTKPGQWKCGVCDCYTPDAQVKCMVCESPKPSSTPAASAQPATAPAPSSSIPNAFFQPQVKPGQWKCGVCDCFTPDSQTKCMVCESPKPASATASATTGSVQPMPPPVSMPSSISDMFKPQVKPGQWKCGVCDCFTPDSQSKCMVCETPRP